MADTGRQNLNTVDDYFELPEEYYPFERHTKWFNYQPAGQRQIDINRMDRILAEA
jgi:hypothetical protein